MIPFRLRYAFELGILCSFTLLTRLYGIHKTEYYADQKSFIVAVTTMTSILSALPHPKELTVYDLYLGCDLQVPKVKSTSLPLNLYCSGLHVTAFLALFPA